MEIFYFLDKISMNSCLVLHKTEAICSERGIFWYSQQAKISLTMDTDIFHISLDSIQMGTYCRIKRILLSITNTDWINSHCDFMGFDAIGYAIVPICLVQCAFYRFLFLLVNNIVYSNKIYLCILDNSLHCIHQTLFANYIGSIKFPVMHTFELYAMTNWTRQKIMQFKFEHGMENHEKVKWSLWIFGYFFFIFFFRVQKKRRCHESNYSIQMIIIICHQLTFSHLTHKQNVI